MRANGLRFHYREWGRPGGPGVLILHGLTGQAWEWDPIAAALADRFRVVALDQRGHGASDWADDYGPDRMVEDLLAIVPALGLGSVRLVGHSMGAINGYLCAARQPALFEQLVICDVGPDTLSPGLVAQMSATLADWARARFADPEVVLAEWLAGRAPAHEAGLRRYILHNLRQRPDGRWVWRFDAARLASFLTSAADEAIQWAALRKLTCPVLIVRGTESWALSAATASRMVDELAHGRLVELPASKHDPHIEQPVRLIAELRAFLGAA